MILDKEVQVKITGGNLVRLINLGYNVKCGDEIIIPIEHLTKGSSCRVNVKCDICGEIYTTKYCVLFKNSQPKINACSKCCNKKSRIACKEMFGVENVFELNSMQDKVKEIILDKYGVKNVSNVPEIRKRAEQTNLERYGVRYPMESPMLVERLVQSINKGIGVKTSSQQRMICEMVNGTLNYIVGRYFADILIPNTNIIIEYNGGGHYIRLKYNETEEELYQREFKRYDYIVSRGYKIITLIAPSNIIPQQNQLEDIISYSKKLFENNNIKFLSFNLETGEIQENNFKI